MRIVLLGGGGYVGQRLASELQRKAENDVVVAERPGFPGLPGEDLSGTLVAMDWRDSASVARAREQIECADAIVHLAFPDWRSLAGSNAEIEKRQVRQGINRLLELAADLGCRVFLHLSTAKVYGRKLPPTVDESVPVRPADLYSELHRTAEEVLENSSPTRAFECVSLRLTNSFGYPVHRSTSRWDLIANEMCRSAATERSIRLGAGAGSYRDFVPIAHVVKVLCRELAVRAIGHAGHESWKAINLCAGRSMSIESMAGRVQERAGLILGGDVLIIRDPVSPDPASRDPEGAVDFRSLYLEPLGDAEFEELTTMELDGTLRRCVEWFV
jgi:UDP-glucose 4-epimerase